MTTLVEPNASELLNQASDITGDEELMQAA